MSNTFDDFIERANKKYRTKLSAKDLPEVKLKPKEKLTLSTGKNSNYAPVILQTKDLDELKSWIGVPEEVSKKRQCRFPGWPDWLPLGVTGKGKKAATERKRTLKSLRPQDHQKMKQLTQAYLYGYAENIKLYKPFIEEYWGQISVPQWWFKRIYVPAGAVVEISPPNTGIFVAYSIEIEDGGRVSCTGSMTLDVTRIEKV